MKENISDVSSLFSRTSQSCFLLMSTFVAAVYCQCVLTTVKSNRARAQSTTHAAIHRSISTHRHIYNERKLYILHSPDFSSSFSCPKFFLPEALPRAILGLRLEK